MAYCAQCGSQNAENAKFCSQCGSPPHAEPPGPPTNERPRDGHHHLRWGRPRTDADERASLNPADAAAVDALPAGSALLVVQRGPGAGSRYLLDTDLSTVGRHPESDIFLDDITVSRRHVEFRRVTRTFGSTTSAASTAPTSTATGSTTPSCRTVTRSASGTSGWSSSPATRRPTDRCGGRRASRSGRPSLT